MQMQQPPPPQQHQHQHQQAAAPPPPNPAAPAPKKKRNQPGNPTDPDAEVIALSPKTLLATNRFVCEVCNKGFQREQNLQLHRRGHNLPWKLKQKNPKDVRRRVYLCPEPTCVHHDPSRALGDLTGIKKHYCRKHGEKKWKCDKCNKRYAVQSDWKAHSKTCGTREYRCDCGTLFSRRDSFITHRAFCDALAQESARVPPIGAGMYGTGGMALGLSGMAASHQLQSFQDQAHSSATTTIGSNPAAQFEHLMQPSTGSPAFRGAQPTSSSSSPFYLGGAEDGHQSQPSHSSLLHGNKQVYHGLMQLPEQHQPGSNNGLLNLGFFSGGSGGQDARLVFPDQFNGAMGGNVRGDGREHGNSGANTESAAIFSGNLMGNQMASSAGFSSSLYNSSETVAPPQMSATALLQKAAQMGATTSSGNVNSLLRGLGNGGGTLNGRPAAGAARFMAGESSSSRSTSQAENESQFRDLMNTLAASGSGAGTAFSGGFPGMDGSKLSTRDFLGVGGGGVMRSMGGAAGLPLRHGAAGIGMGSLDPEMK
ncbi:protein indeterminate-domain 5, chloroplastic isoform X3 [Sorghum bicolor]|nr:protein indeterminate-domain 5, chloroplastic isoform X3 [Sorghum bicolor]|eukprot:XP_021320419.1 protein indeterminate-domain 5, chloroplastic isoform X3 [Sorghum bicolor]